MRLKNIGYVAFGCLMNPVLVLLETSQICELDIFSFSLGAAMELKQSRLLIVR